MHLVGGSHRRVSLAALEGQRGAHALIRPWTLSRAGKTPRLGASPAKPLPFSAKPMHLPGPEPFSWAGKLPRPARSPLAGDVSRSTYPPLSACHRRVSSRLSHHPYPAPSCRHRRVSTCSATHPALSVSPSGKLVSGSGLPSGDASQQRAWSVSCPAVKAVTAG